MLDQTLAKIDSVVAAAMDDLKTVTSAESLEQWRIKYLASDGAVRRLSEEIKAVAGPDKRVVGQRVNAGSASVKEAFELRKATVGQAAPAGPVVDVTEPGDRPLIGNRHPVMKVVDELTELFGRMGFAVAAGPEVEDEFHNFIALNIPRHHPARDPRDNFYLVPPAGKENVTEENLKLLRTQTSTVQIRVMQQQRPPIRVVVPGRVYRPDTEDRTHLSMFHQLEALVVDRGVTMVDLKSTILNFARAYFGDAVRLRFRPSFFPFTEPSAEVDVWEEQRGRWMELGGCGMVHPNVLNACQIDPEEYSGWAFGFGIERIAMRKYAIQDEIGIRHFVQNDVRFLRQF